MKTKGQNFIIECKIYPFDIMVSIDEPDDILFAKLKESGVEDTEWEYVKMSSTNRGRTVIFPGNQTLIRLKKPLTEGVVAHEAFHATAYILDRIGMKLQVEVSDEAYAYMINYIVDEIYKEVK